MAMFKPRILVAAALAALLAACATGPRMQAPGAERQYGFDSYWRSPQARFDDYSKVMLAPVEVDLSRDIVATQTGTRLGLPRSEVQRLRERIASDMTGNLSAALAGTRFALVGDRGAGTLLLTVRLENVYLSPALHDTAQPITTLTRQTVRAEFELIVTDAATGAELARVRDRDTSREDTDLRLRHPQEARSDLDLILARWARAAARMLSDR